MLMQPTLMRLMADGVRVIAAFVARIREGLTARTDALPMVDAKRASA